MPTDYVLACLSHVDARATIHRHWKLNTTATGWPRHTKLVVTKGKPLYVERITKKKRGKGKTKKLLGEVNELKSHSSLVSHPVLFAWFEMCNETCNGIHAHVCKYMDEAKRCALVDVKLI